MVLAMCIEGNERPVRRNPLITRVLYYSQDMESFATGLKRIQQLCDAAGCNVEYHTNAYGFTVSFSRRKKGMTPPPKLPPSYRV